MNKFFLLFILLIFSCDTGNLILVADLPNSLKEISASEVIPNSDLIWVIEDAGNKSHLYGLDHKGTISKDIKISNAKNIDWEDLTSDPMGNLYIGDFGNNNNKRTLFYIYKILNPTNSDSKADVQKTSFELPPEMKSVDFEAFFLFNNYFYVFSKDRKDVDVIRIPNQPGNQSAEFITKFNLKGKQNAVTSADISADGKTVVLLNHDKIWKLSGYKSDHFFSAKVEEQKFEHKSQKEGVCFKSNDTLYITDERKGIEGGNLYAYKLQ